MHATKSFRLFISSTFNDFRKERERLQTRVFPNIREYCSSHGYTFQPIDLRWGISHEAQLDQKTLDLCLEEVRECKRFQHPNFLIMLGDRYGWVPLPYMIEKEELEGLLEFIPSAVNKDDLLEWYKEDLNQIPVSYILKERKNEYINFKCWEGVENRLKSILQNAVNKSKLNEEQRRKYFLSATEAEVVEGIIPYYKPTRFQQEELLKNDLSLENLDPQHIFGFFRSIDTSTRQHDMFIDNDDDYEQAQKFKERVESVLPNNNRLHIDTKQLSQDTLDETYLIEFELAITTFIKVQIDAQKAKEINESLAPLQRELHAQKYFAHEKRKNFIGQETFLAKIASYIENDNPHPLVIHASSGKGKSSLIAKAIEQAENDSRKKVIYRFIGATLNSSSSKEILTSIFEELGIDVRSQEKNQNRSDDFLNQMNDKQETFELFSYRIYKKIMTNKDEIIIFIDAVDQLDNDDQFLWLPKNLPPNVKIIISALDDEDYKDDSIYCELLRIKSSNLLEISDFDKPKELIKSILKAYSRTLQDKQLEYILELYKNVNSPLYIVVVSEEVRNWKSYDCIGGSEGCQQLNNTQHSIVEEYITNLHDFYHHDNELTDKLLGFIYIIEGGLSEYEILEFLNTDETLINKLALQTYHNNTTYEFPIVVWARLYSKIMPFLVTKNVDGVEVISFFHREFRVVAAERIQRLKNHHEQRSLLEKLIKENYQNKEYYSNRWGSVYSRSLGYYLYFNDEDTVFLDSCKFVSTLKNEVWISDFLEELKLTGSDHVARYEFESAIIYFKILLNVSKHLYYKDNNRWVKDLTEALHFLANTCKKVNKIDEAIQLYEEELKLVKNKYKRNPNEWNQEYISVLTGLAYAYSEKSKSWVYFSIEALTLIFVLATLSTMILFSFYLYFAIIQYHQNTEFWIFLSAAMALPIAFKLVYYLDNLWRPIKLAKRAVEILEELYKKDHNQWLEDYACALINLGNLRENEDFAERFYKKTLKVVKELSEKDPSWKFHYARLICNSNLAKFSKNEKYECITLLEENLVRAKEMYRQDRIYFLEYYIASLLELAKAYKKVNKKDESIDLYKKTLVSIEDLYNINHECAEQDYIFVLEELINLSKTTKEKKEFKSMASRIFKKASTEKSNRWMQSYKIRKFLWLYWPLILLSLGYVFVG